MGEYVKYESPILAVERIDAQVTPANLAKQVMLSVWIEELAARRTAQPHPTHPGWNEWMVGCLAAEDNVQALWLEVRGSRLNELAEPRPQFPRRSGATSLH